MKKHIKCIQAVETKSFDCKLCETSFGKFQDLKIHIDNNHGHKCEKCKCSFDNFNQLKNHQKRVHEKKSLTIGSLNICRGLFNKEELLVNTINEKNCDICSVSEVDLEDFDEKKPFSIKGYNTYFPLTRTGTSKKRLICFVKNYIEVKQRDDLMSELLSNVWLEVKGTNQKILICAIYRGVFFLLKTCYC